MSRKEPPPGEGLPPSTRANATGLAGLDHATPPSTTKQQNLLMRTQSPHRQPLNRFGFLSLACGFDDFAQFRPELRLALTLGWARVLR